MYVTERITERHRTQEFASGQQALDGWLQRSALTADRKGTARVYVWTSSDDVVVAYFAVAPHVVDRGGMPEGLGRGDPERIPAVLIAKLALHTSLHGRGLGTRLLFDAFRIVTVATAKVGGRYIVVDAFDERATAFYRRHAFRSGADPSKLFMRVADAHATLKHAGALDD